MRLGSQRWLRWVFLATALVFVGVAVYVYAFRFSARLHPDDVVMALLAEKALHVGSPVVGDWYYVNGDIWVLGPQLIAIPPVAIFGLGPASLLISLIAGFVLQLAGFVYAYLRLCGELWIAMLAAMATSMAWSIAHVDYVYVQLAYGFVTCLYALAFTMFARLADGSSARAWRFALVGLLVAAIAVQNPTRALVYVVGPVLAACVWPWRSVPVRRRLAIAAAAILAWVVALVVYGWLSRAVAFSIPRGHVSFVIGGPSRIKANLVLLGRGLVFLCGGSESAVRAIPGALLVVGSLVLVVREVLASRAITALRFVSVLVLVQLVGVLVPLIVANLLTDKESVRYLMPSMLAMLGLAVMIAVRAAGEAGKAGKAGKGWGRRLAIGWLAAVPLAAVIAAWDARPARPERYVRPDSQELETVADELVRRGLTDGFSINIAANLLTLYSDGAARTCPVTFRNVIIPHRWLADTSCFTASRLPERFFVVADQADRERSTIRETLGPELERFSVGDTYEVFVYRTADTSPAWLDLPIPDGELATFPMHLPATHLQLIRDNVAVEAGDLVASGKPGVVLYGPYLSLPKGDYEASWIGNGIDSGGELTFRVNMSGLRKALASTTLEAQQIPRARGELIRLSFRLDRPRDNIEFPIESLAGGRVALHELVIERKPSR